MQTSISMNCFLGLLSLPADKLLIKIKHPNSLLPSILQTGPSTTQRSFRTRILRNLSSNISSNSRAEFELDPIPTADRAKRMPVGTAGSVILLISSKMARQVPPFRSSQGVTPTHPLHPGLILAGPPPNFSRSRPPPRGSIPLARPSRISPLAVERKSLDPRNSNDTL